MTDVKSWIQSKTIWAILVTLSPFITKFVGFDMDATLADILTVAGGAGAIYFRIVASKKLS